MKYLLSIDPGVSTGVALFSYDDDTPAELVRAWQFGGGLSGFLRWVEPRAPHPHRDENHWDFTGLSPWSSEGVEGIPRAIRFTDLSCVAEKFTPLQNKGFSLTLDSVEPLRIEGAMVAMGLLPDYDYDTRSSWQRPNQMYWVPGKNATEKRRNQVAWVKERFPELHLTGKNVDAPDADDARSALWHGMVWLRKYHQPSAERWFGSD